MAELYDAFRSSGYMKREVLSNIARLYEKEVEMRLQMKSYGTDILTEAC
jgi:hypothetical protein